MKIILSGSTGFIGSAVLQNLLSNRKITSVVALSRRPLAESHPKLKTLIVSEFDSYSPDILDQLAGADACIWALGIAVPPDSATGIKVNYEYPVVSARTFASQLAPRRANVKKPFRFLLLSGTVSEPDQSKRLWFLEENRKLRGKTETDVLAVADEHPGAFRAYVAKPGAVRLHNAWTMGSFVGLIMSHIFLDELAAAMVEIVAEGGEPSVWENDSLAAKGKEVLASSDNSR